MKFYEFAARAMLCASTSFIVGSAFAIPVVYVNGTTGNDSNAGDAGAPVKTITQGILNVDAGGTVNVAAGTYAEQIALAKSVKLFGTNAGISPTTGTRVAETVLTANAPVVLFQAGAEFSVVDGFKFTGSPNDVDDGIVRAASGPNDITVACNIFDANASRAMNATAVQRWNIHDNLVQNVTGTQESGFYLITMQNSTIAYNRIANTTYGGIIVDSGQSCSFQNNTIQNVTQAGIQIANSVGPTQITGNAISQANTLNSADKGAITLYVNVTNVNITGNSFSASNGAVAIRNQAGTVSDTIHVNQNNIAGNTGTAVKNLAQGGGLLDATNNWWGSNTGPTHSSNPGGLGDSVSNNVTYSPWLATPSGVEDWRAY